MDAREDVCTSYASECLWGSLCACVLYVRVCEGVFHVRLLCEKKEGLYFFCSLCFEVVCMLTHTYVNTDIAQKQHVNKYTLLVHTMLLQLMMIQQSSVSHR